MPFTNRGRWSSSTLTERGRIVTNGLTERGYEVFGLSTSTTIAEDSFNRADSTTSLGVADSGQTWLYDNAEFGISSNQAYPASTPDSSLYSYAFIDSGKTDVSVQVTLATLVKYMVLLFRYKDLNNLYFVRTNGNIDGYEVYKRVAGTWTLMASFAGASVGDFVKVVTNGDSIKVFINDVEKASITDTDNSTNTNHGIGKLYDIGSADIKFDDFLVESGQELSVVDSGTISLSSSGNMIPQANYITDDQLGLSSNTDLVVTERYLQMDGVDDYIQMPSVTMNSIEIDLFIDNTQPSAKDQYLIDARTGLTDGFFTESQRGAGWGDTWYINGVAHSTSDITTPFPKDKRCTVQLNAISTFTDDVTLFSYYGILADYYLKGNIYSIKCYDGTTLVAHYDTSTGTLDDQSGNGNHATLTGGTWVEDNSSVVDSGTISLASNTEISGLGSATFDNQSIISGVSDLSTIPNRTRDTLLNVSSTTQVDSTSSRISYGGSNINSQSNMDSSSRIIADTFSVLSSNTDLVTTSSIIAGTFSVLSSNTDLAAISSIITSDIILDLSSNTTLSSKSNIVADMLTNLSSDATLFPTSNRIRDILSDLSSNTDLSSSSNRIRDVLSDLSFTSSLFGDSVKITDVQSNLASISELTTIGDIISVNVKVNLSSTGNVDVLGNRIIQNDSNLNTTSNLSTTGSKILDALSNFSGNGDLVVNGEVIELEVIVNLDASSEATVSGTKFIIGQSEIKANGEFVTSGTVIYDGESLFVASAELAVSSDLKGFTQIIRIPLLVNTKKTINLNI